MGRSNYSPFGHERGHMRPDGEWVRNSDEPVEQDDSVPGSVPVNGNTVAGNQPGSSASFASGDNTTAPNTVKFAISSATADAAVLYTVPTGKVLVVSEADWQVDTAFSGGTAAAIGISSSAPGATAKGSILGGADGDDIDVLGSTGIKEGTRGTALSSGELRLPAGSTIKFDRITSAFTAGAGFARVRGRLEAA